MSGPAQAMNTDSQPSHRKHPAYQAGVLGAFSLAAAALLAMGDLATRDAIEQARAADLLASLGQVLPAAIYDNDLLADAVAFSAGPAGDLTFYRAAQGPAVTGVAFKVRGQGYGGPIDLLLGVDRRGQILGVRVLAHKETPGLGDRIEIGRDDWIRGFDGLSLDKLPPAAWAVKKDGGHFDQFSGATITPRAVVAAVKDGLLAFEGHRDALVASAVVGEPAGEATNPGDRP